MEATDTSAPQKLASLTGFRRDVLYVIAGSDKLYGLAIKEQLEVYYESEVNHGQLYPNLNALVEQGLVEKGELDKRTNYYELTDRGRRALRQRSEWEAQHFEEVSA
ncbi:PadR family transcriptional regulator [Natronorubrum thiooxidans]|uniref:Transcriptional regulator PadR-like family protein n=1 Tax=Natronorubrum thiooxidans TaxID=308853 RepID=A0A1N7HA44_9EURY|nr:PadR family transcriptional regulator [Natronorubrum thiooxidans]SIS21749.1 Transcriptional regulator PadR-like family protein [Natronorubrum thiooxidans]